MSLLDGLPAPTSRIGFRRWREGDAAALARAWADPEIRRFSAVPEPADVDTARRWIRGEPERRDRLMAVDLVMTTVDGAEVLGEVGLSHVDLDRRAALIGYWVAEPARGSGVASTGVEAVSRWALDQGGLDALIARIDPLNQASVVVANNAGFDLLGAVGPDEVHYVRRKSAGPARRRPPGSGTLPP